MTTLAIRPSETGGPEPGPGEALVCVEAAGVNFM
jgi:NADPH:quinone reductase-like Zn-dependent oxidoreductase